MSPRRPMRRVGDMLPGVAAQLGIEAELRLARQMADWQRIVGEHVPAAAGGSHLLSVQPPALVVSAVNPAIAQELRLRQVQLLASFAQLPQGVRLLELRVVVRPPGGAERPSGGRGGPR
jgi:hypothetical protein